MGFKADDKVKVVKLVGPTESCNWLSCMDEYVGDGKEHNVLNDTDRDGDTLVNMADGQCFYFPAGSLELIPNDAGALLSKISAAYNYNGQSYRTVGAVRRALVQEAYLRFANVGIEPSDEAIDNLINELNTAKETCLKLK